MATTDQTRPRVGIKPVAPGDRITAARENQIIEAVNELRLGIGPGKQVPRKPAVDATGVEATTRVFFCS